MGLSTRSGSRDRSDPDVAIKAYCNDNKCNLLRYVIVYSKCVRAAKQHIEVFAYVKQNEMYHFKMLCSKVTPSD